MASSQVLATPTSQCIVNGTVSTVGHTLAILGVLLPQRLGQSQTVTLRATIDGTITVEFEVILFDEAFDELGLYGEQKGRKKRGGPTS